VHRAHRGVAGGDVLQPGGRIRDSESYAESLYAQLHFGYAPLRALRGDGWKLIDAPKAELYRLPEDPGETKNLLDARAPVANAMRAKLAGYDKGAGAAPELPALDADAASRLAALGYDVGDIDGKIGKGTRAAVKDLQLKMGLPADSYPDASFFEALRNS